MEGEAVPSAAIELKKFEISAEVVKFDEDHGIVFGFGVICKEDGEPYFDLQGDHIPEEAMLEASVDFMENSRVVKEMHEGSTRGAVVFAFPLTTDVAKAFDITTKRTGFMIGVKPDESMLAKFRSGELTGFSIGGVRIKDEPVAYGEAAA